MHMFVELFTTSIADSRSGGREGGTLVSREVRPERVPNPPTS